MKADFSMDLKPLDSAHCAQIREWRNDYRIWRWCRQNDLISDVEQASWFERQSKDPTIKMYAVYRAVSGVAELVGVAGFTSIDWFNRRAEFSLYVRPDRHGQGIATAALRLLLSHGFTNLGFGQIWGETFDGNPALKIFVRLGMTIDGRRRRFYFKDGAFHDAYLVSMLREEWEEKHGNRRDPNSGPALDHSQQPTADRGHLADHAGPGAADGGGGGGSEVPASGGAAGLALVPPGEA